LERRRAGHCVVLKVAQESETIVQLGTPLLDVGDPHDLEIVVDVLSTDAVEIRPGADVTIVHWDGQGPLNGRVRRVKPAAFTKISTLGVEGQRINVLVDITSPAEQWARLGDADQVDAQIVVFTRDDATIVPAGALFRRGDQWNVYVVKDGRAQIHEVQVLRRSSRFAAIASGFEPRRIRYRLSERSRRLRSAGWAAQAGRLGGRLLTSINTWMRPSPQIEAIPATLWVEALLPGWTGHGCHLTGAQIHRL
jgi:hypothetical protein